MAEKNFSFLVDTPIDQASSDLLWGNGLNTEAGQQINEIASRITEPLTEQDRLILGDSLTFAIHGRWGAGKTSFVRLIEAHARRLMQENEPRVDDSRLVFCEYNAANNQIAQDNPDRAQITRVNMTMQVLLSLARSELGDPDLALYSEPVKTKALEIFTLRAFQDKVDIETLLATDLSPFERNVKINEYLEQVSQELAHMSTFRDIIDAELSGGGTLAGIDRVLVFFVDDLDRCRQQDVKDILDVVQQWKSINRVYFLLAIDRHILDSVIVSHYGEFVHSQTDHEIAVEKYVQHSYEIPELKVEDIERYVQVLFSSYEESIVSKTILDNINLLASGVRIRTPRSIKRCINTIRLPLNSLIAQERDKEDNVTLKPELKLKEELLRYTWRNFYTDFYTPARDQRSGFYSAFIALERAATLYSQDEQLYEFELDRIRSRLQIDKEKLAVDFELAEFLSIEPWFFLTEDMLQSDTSALALLTGITSAEDTKQQEDIQEWLSSPKAKFDELYKLNEQARDAEDAQRLVETAAEIAQLLNDHFDVLPEDIGHLVGNVALRVEPIALRIGTPQLQSLAHTLFDASYRLNPNHANNNCNYASFIADAKYPALDQLYMGAYTQILGENPEVYRLARRLERYYFLRAQLAHKIPDLGDTYKDHIQSLVVMGTRDALLRGVALADTLKLGDEEATQILVEPIMTHTTDDLQSLCLKGLADLYSDNYKGCELYRWIDQNFELVKHTADAKHNYAVNLRNLEFYQEALEQWFVAYHFYINTLKEADDNICNSFSRFVDDYCVETSMSDMIKSGQPLPAKPTLKVDSNPIPDQFVDGGIRSILNGFID